eukprot:jgi/Chlat1/8167/Chrsp76S07649
MTATVDDDNSNDDHIVTTTNNNKNSDNRNNNKQHSKKTADYQQQRRRQVVVGPSVSSSDEDDRASKKSLNGSQASSQAHRMLIGRLGLASKSKANATITAKDINKSSFATKKTPVSQRFYRATVCMSDATLPHPHKQPPTPLEVAAGGSDSRAVRALAIEAASAREELRRSEKRRAHSTARHVDGASAAAVAVCQELESKCAALEKDANELKYSNTQLRKELQATGEAAASAAARNRSALGVLRSGLAAVEETVARRSALGFQHLQAVFASLQQLQGLLLSPAVSLSVPAASAQARSVLSESFSRLSALSNALGGQPDTVRGDPPALLTASGRNNNNNKDGVGVEGGRDGHGYGEVGSVAERKLAEMEREKGRLSTQLAEAQAELARMREGGAGNNTTASSEAAAAASQLLPQYRAALVRSRAQCAAMRERLAEAERARRAARQEMEMMQRLIRQRELEKVAEVSEVAKRAATEQQHQYSQDLQVLRQKLMHGDEAYRRLKLDHQALQVHAAELEENVEQLRATVSELQVTVSEQRADIRAALEMVMSRRTRSGGGGGVAGPNISRMMADILSSHISPFPPRDASHAMPTVAATMDDFLLHDDYNGGIPLHDDFLLGSDLNSLPLREPSSVTPAAQFQQVNQNSGPVVLDTLQRDIAALDADISHLQASLESTAANTHAMRVD